MPTLDTSIHIDMYQSGKEARSFSARVRRAIRVLFSKDYYGLEWGDPDTLPPLTYIRDHYLLPYVAAGAHVVEIGPGGGRWTRYMLRADRIYAVDYHQELLGGLRSTFPNSNLTLVKNQGDDFPGIPARSIDLVFSFGTFVHLDPDIIERYLKNIQPLLKPESNVVIQYSDMTKPLGKSNAGFSDNNPTRMRALVLDNGFSIFEEDTQTLWHSSVIRFGLAQPAR